MRYIAHNMNNAIISKFESWTSAEIKIFKKLSSPYKIQDFLDELHYSHDDFTRSPRETLKAERAHCFDGALVAAAALEQLGYPPLIVDLFADDDDDHVIAIFKKNDLFGAVAKSNFSGLRYREPVYRNLRELVMSYYEGYYNLKRKRTLRLYSLPFNLRRLDSRCWRTSQRPVDFIGSILNKTKHFRVIPKNIVKDLTLVDKRLFQAGKVGMTFK